MSICQVITKSGKKCRNRVAKGRYCYLHKKSRLSTPRKSRKSRRRSFKKKSRKSRTWRGKKKSGKKRSRKSKKSTPRKSRKSRRRSFKKKSRKSRTWRGKKRSRKSKKRSRKSKKRSRKSKKRSRKSKKRSGKKRSRKSKKRSRKYGWWCKYGVNKKTAECNRKPGPKSQEEKCREYHKTKFLYNLFKLRDREKAFDIACSYTRKRKGCSNFNPPNLF